MVLVIVAVMVVVSVSIAYVGVLSSAVIFEGIIGLEIMIVVVLVSPCRTVVVGVIIVALVIIDVVIVVIVVPRLPVIAVIVIIVVVVIVMDSAPGHASSSFPSVVVNSGLVIGRRCAILTIRSSGVHAPKTHGPAPFCDVVGGRIQLMWRLQGRWRMMMLITSE